MRQQQKAGGIWGEHGKAMDASEIGERKEGERFHGGCGYTASGIDLYAKTGDFDRFSDDIAYEPDVFIGCVEWETWETMQCH